MMREGSAFRAALYLSMADVFLAAAGLILALIVLAADTEDPRSLRQADLTATCTGSAPDWRITTGDRDMTIDAFIKDTSGAPVLMQRIALRTGPEALRCFQALDAAIAEHNISLGSRGTVAAALAVTWIPEDHR